MGDVGRGAGTGVRTRWLRAAELSPVDVQAWRELGERALEPNAYLSVDVVLPALLHLDRSRPVHLLLIESTVGETCLIGAIALEAVNGTTDLPLPHLRVYHSLHTFLSGLLLDRERAAWAMRGLFDFLEHNRMRWNGIEVPQMWATGPTQDLLQAECAARDALHGIDLLYQRPVLHSHELDAVLHQRRGRVRDLVRRERRLAELGDVTWRWVCGGDVSPGQVLAFLRLEHLGWKGSAGTSMKSDPAQIAYFGDVVDRLASQGRVFFTELMLNGEVIASTCNFTTGDTAHAFKVAWDPAYARFAPGFLSELEIMRRGRAMVPHIAHYESGGSETAYVAQMWASRQPLANVTIGTTAVGKNAMRAKALYVATRERVRHGVAQAALTRYDAMALIDHAIDRLARFI